MSETGNPFEAGSAEYKKFIRERAVNEVPGFLRIKVGDLDVVVCCNGPDESYTKTCGMPITTVFTNSRQGHFVFALQKKHNHVHIGNMHNIMDGEKTGKIAQELLNIYAEKAFDDVVAFAGMVDWLHRNNLPVNVSNVSEASLYVSRKLDIKEVQKFALL